VNILAKFNTRILDATNYANQDYMRVDYTFIVVYTMLWVTGSQSKKRLDVFAWIWPNSDRWLVNHCAMMPSISIGQTWALASIGAIVEMGVLSTLKRLLMESNGRRDAHNWLKLFCNRSCSVLGIDAPWIVFLKETNSHKFPIFR
jgi:hypothetical protein